MSETPNVYAKTYKDYLEQVHRIDVDLVSQRLGIDADKNRITIPLFDKFYTVTRTEITDPDGKQPAFDICVILSKYLLLCPEITPTKADWVSFKDLKDGGPLTTYFVNDVESAIAKHFTGNIEAAATACKMLGGFNPAIDAAYDVAAQFDALPKVPLMLLFNDADDEFPAQCSVLFERRAENYLDPECLAMTGRLLFSSLKRVACL